MFGLVALDIAIGLVFLYGILSLVTSTLTELVSGWLNLRGKNLREALVGMLRDGALMDQVLNHPAIAALSKDGKMPSYLPSSTFARTLVHVLAEQHLAPGPAAQPAQLTAALRESLAAAPNAELARVISSLLSDAAFTAEEVRIRLEGWFDQTMARASGWFKRRVTKFLLIFGFLVTALLNADTIQVIRTLNADGPIRDAIVARAGSVVADRSTVDETASPRDLVEDNIGQLVGWSEEDLDTLFCRIDLRAWFLKLIGLGVTGIAVSLGAPIWFQLLEKLVSLRSSVREPLAQAD